MGVLAGSVGCLVPSKPLTSNLAGHDIFSGAFLVKVRSMAILIMIERDQMNPELQGTLRVRDIYIYIF